MSAPKTIYTIETLRAMRCLVDGIPPPKAILMSRAYDSGDDATGNTGAGGGLFGSKQRTLAKNRSSSEDISRHGLPPRQLSHENFGGRESFFGGSQSSLSRGAGGGRGSRENSTASSPAASPAPTMWVYRTKGSDQVSGSTSWADVQALIDDLLVEQDEIELKPVNATSFMDYDQAVAYRNGQQNQQQQQHQRSTPTSPDWRASAGQRFNSHSSNGSHHGGGGFHANREQHHGGHHHHHHRGSGPRIPQSPSFGENSSTSSHHNHHHSSHHHHHHRDSNNNSTRSTWTRDDMATKPQPMHGIQALGADIDEMDLGLGSIAPVLPRSMGSGDALDIGGNSFNGSKSGGLRPPSEIGTPSKLGDSSSGMAPMPMMPAPIDIGQMAAGAIDAPDPVVARPPPGATAQPPPAPAGLCALGEEEIVTKKVEAPRSLLAAPIGIAPTIPAVDEVPTTRTTRSANLDAGAIDHESATAKSNANAWGAQQPLSQVDFQQLLNDTPPTAPAPSSKSDWHNGSANAQKTDTSENLPSLDDVASGVSKKEKKDAKLHKSHMPGGKNRGGGGNSKDDEGFWEGANGSNESKKHSTAAAAVAEQFPSLDSLANAGGKKKRK